jgi:pimeloyl-ACP methyl ester carboxylesterase
VKRQIGLVAISLSMAALGGPQSLQSAFAADTNAGQPLQATAPADSCSKLGSLKLKDVKIVSATSLAEGAPIPNAGLLPMFGNTPVLGKASTPMCRVVGRIKPTATSDIGFEVWLPANGWNGRLHGIGIGGFAGVIDYFTLGSAVKGGQVGLATNTGHSGTMQEYGWAVGQPEQVRDYSWRGVHLSTVAAKKLVAAYYGRGPDKSYFVGCSGGGRQGLVAAARFPEDYDGVLAGAPAASFTKLAMSLTNTVQAQSVPGAAIRFEQAKFIQSEVVKQCDGGDGQVDGLIADPRQCRFDPAKLSCSVSSSPQCLSDPQITALGRIHAGPRSSKGVQLAGGYLPSGSESGDPSPMLGWEGYLLQSPKGIPGGEGLANGMLGALIQKPFATPATFDWERHAKMLRKASRELDAPLDLSKFFARGGKLVIWHGWADAAIPPEHSLDYYNAMLRRSGAKASGSSRLFMVPGVQHCFGGAGSDSFGSSGAPGPNETAERNMVLALQDWREGKRPAPETLVARRGHSGGMMGAGTPGPERQRRLCAWPKREALKPGGDPDKAESYTCEKAGAQK